jgi:hypothetical protein
LTKYGRSYLIIDTINCIIVQIVPYRLEATTDRVGHSPPNPTMVMTKAPHETAKSSGMQPVNKGISSRQTTILSIGTKVTPTTGVHQKSSGGEVRNRNVFCATHTRMLRMATIASSVRWSFSVLDPFPPLAVSRIRWCGFFRTSYNCLSKLLGCDRNQINNSN